MRVKGLIWLGLRTTYFEETTRLFRDVMGMEQIRTEEEIAGFALTNGTEVEVYRPEEDFHAFFSSGPVVAFLVDDVEEARATMEAAGVEFIGPIQRTAERAWNHFKAPDGTVFEIMSLSEQGSQG